MIFANSGAGHYWWIDHAPWNGLHIADLVFPFFLWIMGVCIPISIKSQHKRKVSRMNMFKGVLIRSLKLFLLGLCLGTVNGSHFDTLRIFGVLQRFGIAYFVVGTLHISFSPTYPIPCQGNIAKMIMDILVLSREWIAMIGIILLNMLIVFRYPVPNCPM